MAAAGCSDSYSSSLYFSGYDEPSLAAAETRAESYRLEPVGHWGEFDGPLAFSSIGAIAAQGRWLVVADGQTCSLKVIDLGGSPIRTIGRCGEGPGEFVDLNALGFERDGVILASDRGTGRLYRIDLGTASVSPLSYRDHLPDSFVFISTIGSAGPEGAIVGLRIQPAVRGLGSHSLVARLDFREGSVVQTMVEDAPIAKQTPRPFLRGALVCAVGKDWAVTSIWFPQTIVFDGESGRPLANFGTAIDWRLPQDRPEGLGEWGPALPLPGLGCTENLVAISYLERGTVGGERRMARGYLEIRSARGEILYSQLDEWPDQESPTALTVGAMAGDTLFLFGNSTGLFPMVRAFRLTKR